MIPLFINKHSGMPKFLLGPHFFVFIPAWIISVGLLCYIIGSMWGKTYFPFLILSIFMGILFLYMYAKIGLSNPGIASVTDEPDLITRSQERYCIPCRIVRPKGTKHCYYCDICIHGFDHHCPWVGKCIGKDNCCLFYQFLISIGAMFVVLLLTALNIDPTK